MFYFILLLLGIYLGYKLRKIIEILLITKNVKYIQVTVDKILNVKNEVNEKIINKSGVSKEDFKKFLEYKKNCEV